MTDAVARLARAERASAAMQEFIAPALSVIRDEYMAKLRELAATRVMQGEPLAMVQRLATAMKIVEQVEVQMRAVIADGEVAKADVDRASTIAHMGTEQRRYAGY